MGTPPCANVWNILETRCDGRRGALDAGIETNEVLAGTVGRFGRLRGLLFVRLEEFCREQTVVRDLVIFSKNETLTFSRPLLISVQPFKASLAPSSNREKIVPQCRAEVSANLLRRNASTVSSILDS